MCPPEKKTVAGHRTGIVARCCNTPGLPPAILTIFLVLGYAVTRPQAAALDPVLNVIRSVFEVSIPRQSRGLYGNRAARGRSGSRRGLHSLPPQGAESAEPQLHCVTKRSSS